MGTANRTFNGSRLRFRPVTLDDAAYIHSLRTEHGQYLSAPAPSVAAQQAWTQGYLTRAAQGLEYYFIIERLMDGAPCGTMRIYDIGPDAATWGSFILTDAKPQKAALDALLLVHKIIFETLGLPRALFDVRAANNRALSLYQRFGGIEIDRNDLDIYFRIDAEDHAARRPDLIEQIWAPDTKSVNTESLKAAAKPTRRKGSVLARHYKDEPTKFWARLAFHFKRKKLQIGHRAIWRLQEATLNQHRETLKNRLLRAILHDVPPATQIFPLATYGAVGQTVQDFTLGAQVHITPPRAPKADAAPVATDMPGTSAHLFRNVDAFPSASALVSGDHVAVPDLYIGHQQAIISDGHFLMLTSRDDRGIVVLRDVMAQHKAGIMLFGAGAYNWYHWLIETLPAAYLAQCLPNEYADYPLVIPGEIANAPTFRQSLEVFRGNRDVIVLGKGMHRFDNLIQIDAPVREPMNMREGFWPVPQDYAFHGQTLRDYRDQIIQRLHIETPPHQDRIFLARGHGRRTYNQDALLEIAVQHGFRAVYPENLSLREQVALYRGASHIIGPSGAAFANTLFCQPKTLMLSWLVPQYKGFCSYANIAQLTGSDLRYLFAVPDTPINSTADAYRASYQIDIAAFRGALVAMEQPGY